MSLSFAGIGQNFRMLATLESELQAGLGRFWKMAEGVLDGSSIRLMTPDQTGFSLARNFFSTLFLYSYFRSGIPSERRVLYVAINQCLRAMVTGCDNILDDEYKITLETDLPPQAHRFRSVLDIMVADRVLFALLADHCRRHSLGFDRALRASEISLQSLTRSGAQEASEEGGVKECLAPEIVLEKIHHYKTGILFQATWAIPAVFEDGLPAGAMSVQEALYQIGIGCQIFDDMVDLFVDLREQRHNYVASVIVHREPRPLREQMNAMLLTEQTPERFYAANPEFARRMKNEAQVILEKGLGRLFLDEHQGLIEPAAQFLADRIGVRPE